MKRQIFLGLKQIAVFVVLLFLYVTSFGQLILTPSSTINTVCNGNACTHDGPTILINEVQAAPTSYDGSIWETNCANNSSGTTRCGEWIELYNPHKCQSVDISYYFLGNNAPDGSNYGGGFLIPAGTIIPPQGFCIIRGQNAPLVPSNLLVTNGGKTVVLTVDNNIVKTCLGGGSRLWFPNAGGWFAFYDRNGVAQDAISWGASNNSCLGCNPCTPNGNPYFSGTLPSYSSIPANRKNIITSSALSAKANTFRRIPDGGNWAGEGVSSIGTCNSTCVPPFEVTCNGTVSVAVSGGTPPYKYLWNDTKLQTTATASGLCAGTYRVVVTDAIGVQTSIDVVVDDFKPTVTASPLSSVCAETSLFTVAGYSPANATISGTGISGTSFNPAVAGVGTHTLTISYTDANGCANSAQTSITVGKVSATLDSGRIVCHGDNNGKLFPVITQGTAPYTYSWNTNPVQATDTAINLSAGNYTLTITDQSGCQTKVSAALTNPDAVPVSLDSMSPVCFTAPPFTWTGLNPVNGILSGNGIVQGTTTFNPALAGMGNHRIVYTYTTDRGCVDSATTSILVKHLEGTVLEIQKILCADVDKAVLLVQGFNGTAPYHYLWNTAQTTDTLKDVLSGDYKVKISDAAGCSIDLSITVESPDTLELTLTSANEICQGACDGKIEVNPTGGVQPYNFTWSNGSGIQNQINLCPGTYQLTMTDANGCQRSESATINTEVFIQVDLTSHSEKDGITETVYFDASGLGVQTYFWNFGDGNTSTGISTNHVYESTGDFTVMLIGNSESPYFCRDTATTVIRYVKESKIKIPNVFTPNGDGVNDTFYPETVGLLSEEMRIYDRWGRLIYKWEELGEKWDGRNLAGNEVASSVYYYVYKALGMDNVKYMKNGSITLIRE